MNTRLIVTDQVHELAENAMEMPCGIYDLVPACFKVSTCQLEVMAKYILTFFLNTYEDLLIFDTIGDRQLYVPLRVPSFDLECKSTGVDQFLGACNDSIFQIAGMVSYHGVLGILNYRRTTLLNLHAMSIS